MCPAGGRGIQRKVCTRWRSEHKASSTSVAEVLARTGKLSWLNKCNATLYASLNPCLPSPSKDLRRRPHLQVAHDVVVDRQLARHHRLEVLAHLKQPRAQAAQASHHVADLQAVAREEMWQLPP